MQVVDHPSGDDRVELAVDLPEVALPVARAGRRERIDAERVVARGHERRHDAALVAAADLEHPRRSRGQVR